MNPANQSIVIRNIEDLGEMREVERFQKEIWGVSDLDVFPALAFRPLKEVGSILIGAFSNRELVGFVFGFPGILNGEPIIHSDMLAVKPEFRSQSLGFLLKVAQRQAALEKGLKRITWTFDPLRSVNAHLNFAKLGVISDRYEVDFYGETSSPLHHGSTDRLWVTWLLDSHRVHKRITDLCGTEPSKFEIVRLLGVDEGNSPVFNSEAALAGRQVIVEIPDESSYANPEKLTDWRHATRRAFQELLAKGFIVEDFLRQERDGKRVGIYLCNRDSSLKS